MGDLLSYPDNLLSTLVKPPLPPYPHPHPHPPLQCCTNVHAISPEFQHCIGGGGGGGEKATHFEMNSCFLKTPV